MASISRRKTKKGEWRYDVLYRSPEGPERSRTFTTLKDAKRFSNTVEADKLRGEWVDPRHANMTVSDIADLWLASNPSKRPTTVATDDLMVRVHIVPKLGNRRVGSVTRSDVQELVNAWTASAAPRTVRRRFGVLSSVFSFAAENDWVARSPVRGIKVPSPTTTRSHRLEPTDVTVIADATSEEYRPMVWLGALLGLRWSEVAGLRVGRLDLLRKEVTVAEAVTRDGKGGPVFTAPKSSAGARTLAIPAELAEMLAQHLRQLGITGADPEALLFPAPEGGPLRYANRRRRVWQPASIAAGVGTLTQDPKTKRERYTGAGFHDLRRANATGLVLAGVDVKTAQARLGHSDPRLTLGVYAQATSAADKAAAEALGTHFSGLARDARGIGNSAT